MSGEAHVIKKKPEPGTEGRALLYNSINLIRSERFAELKQMCDRNKKLLEAYEGMKEEGTRRVSNSRLEAVPEKHHDVEVHPESTQQVSNRQKKKDKDRANRDDKDAPRTHVEQDSARAALANGRNAGKVEEKSEEETETASPDQDAENAFSRFRNNLVERFIEYAINRPLVLCLFALLLSLPSYLPGFFFSDFFMDDSVGVQKNPDVIAPELDWDALMRHDFWGSDMFSGVWTHKSFRPLTTLSFRWNFLLHGMYSIGFHFTNCSLHYLNSVLVGWVAYSVLGLSTAYSVLAMALFAVHPVHTESVHYIVGRADILACICYLLAIGLYSYFYNPHHRHTHTLTHIYTELVKPLIAWVLPPKEEKTDKKKALAQIPVSKTNAVSFLSQFCHDDGLLDFDPSKQSEPSGVSSGVTSVRSRRTSWVSLIGGVGGLVWLFFMAVIGGLCKESGFTVFGIVFGMEGLTLIHHLANAHHAHTLLKEQADKKAKDEKASAKTLPPSLMTREVSSSLLRIACVLVMTGVVGYVRFTYTGGTSLKMSPQDNPVSFEPDGTVRKLTYAYLHGVYFRLLYAPFWLCYDYSMNAIPMVTSIKDPRMLLPLFCYVSLAALLYLGLRLLAHSYVSDTKIYYRSEETISGDETRTVARRDYDREIAVKNAVSGQGRSVLIAFALMVIPFLPAANVFFPVGTVIGERLLYIPSLGFCYLVCLLPSVFLSWRRRVELEKRQKKLLREIETAVSGDETQDNADSSDAEAETRGDGSEPSRVGGWLRIGYRVMFPLFVLWGAWAVKCYYRTMEWESSHKIFLYDGLRQPNSAKTQFNLGITYMMAHDYPRARAALKRSIRADSSSVLPFWRLGQIAIMEGNYVEAVHWLTESTTKYGGAFVVKDEEVFHDLAVALHQTGKRDQAQHNLKLALQLNPVMAKAWNNLACSVASTDIRQALGFMEKAVESDPTRLLYWSNLVAVARFAGDEQMATVAWNRVQAMLPPGRQGVDMPHDCTWEFAPAE